MADLALKISADFEQAQKAFNDLAAGSEHLQNKIQQWADGMKAAHVDDFIDRQDRLAVAMTAAGKESEVLTTQTKNYQREIQRLVDAGLTPESTEIKALQGELIKLVNSHEKEVAAVEAAAQREKEYAKAIEAASKVALASLAAIGAAVAAVAGFSIKAAADVEDMVAAFQPLMGSADKAAKLVKQIQIEAAATPFEIDGIAKSVKSLMPAFNGSADVAMKAFKMIGDTAQGNGQKLETITSAYTKVMLKGKVSMEELNMIADAGVPIYSELAASMDVSVAQMMKMSSDGKITADDLTAAFHKMTDEGGIFYEGMELASVTFNSTLSGLKENIGIIAGTIGEELLPYAKKVADAAYDATRSFMDWIHEGDNLNNLLGGLKIGLAGATGALSAFIIVSNKAKAIEAVTVAIKGLAAAVAGPAGIAALAIGGLAAGIAALAVYTDKQNRGGEIMANQMKQTSDKASELLSTYEQLNPGKEIDVKTTEELVKLYPELTDKIKANNTTMEEANRLEKEAYERRTLEAAGIWIDKIIKQEERLGKAREEAREYAEKAAINIAQAEAMGDMMKALEFKEAIDVYNSVVDSAQNNMNKSVTQANALLANIGKQLGEGNKIVEIPIAITPPGSINETITRTIEDVKKTLQQRLSDIEYNPTQQLNERIDQIKSFLSQRAGLERVSGEERIAFYNQQAEALKVSDKLTAEERIAAVKAVDEAILETRKQMDAELLAQATKQRQEEERIRQEADAEKKRKQEEEQNYIRNSLLALGQTEAQAEQERIDLFKQFLAARLEAEKKEGADRIEYIEEQEAELLANMQLTEDVKLSLIAASNALQQSEQKKLSDSLVEIKKNEVSTMAGFFGALSDLSDAAFGDTVAGAVASKALAAAQAAINSYLAASQAMTVVPYPFNFVAAATVLAAGLANQIKIMTTPLPSAETGGRFAVPDVGRVDGALMRVNPGEMVDVTPRGMAGETTYHFQFVFDKQVLYDIINRGARAGELNTLKLAGNV
ncbi:MAG: tape measure protein [Treponema sp.]|jgi:tape measure domain-containing protein|nr:tape measure protein [Treponema sp.]